jgi:hypothetical protein
MRLSVGATPIAKVVGFFVCLALAAAAGLGAYMAWQHGAPRHPGAPASHANGGVLFAWRTAALLLAPTSVLLLYAALRVLRHAAWLDETVVIVRTAFRKRKVDLSTASLGGGPIDRIDQRSHLFVGDRLAIMAMDSRRNVQVKLPLRGFGLPNLPGDQLDAVARAIMTNRKATDADFTVAESIAGQLRRLARREFDASLPRQRAPYASDNPLKQGEAESLG